MNDRFWTMKIVVEKVRIFICAMKNEIPLFREFPSSGSTKEPLSECLCGIHFLLSGPTSEETLITVRVTLAQLKLVRGFQSI